MRTVVYCATVLRYLVGDNHDMCGSLACVGGTQGLCNRYESHWAHRKVICDPALPAGAPIDLLLRGAGRIQDPLAALGVHRPLWAAALSAHHAWDAAFGLAAAAALANSPVTPGSCCAAADSALS